MLRNFKKLVSLVLVLAISLVVSLPAFAAETKSGAKIKLDDIYVTTKYDPNSITVDRHETNSEVQVTVKDKTSGKVLDVWGEEKAKLSDSTMKPQMEGTFEKRVYHDKDVGPVKARVYALLEMYQYDSFVQINGVKKMWWSKASSGNWTIEDTSTDYHMDQTPGLTVDFYCTATVTVTTTSSTTGSFSIKFLEDLGFSVAQTSGSTYYARLPIDNDFGFSVN